MKIGNRLKGILNMYDIQQKEVAEFLKISDSGLSDKLNSKTKIDIENELIPIIKFINSHIPKEKSIDPNYIFEWPI